MKKIDEQAVEEVLSRGVGEIVDRDHLKSQLQSGRTLRIKLGIDPTSPSIHLGRAVPLLKLRDFQDLGHKIVLIIGDFTGVIGDTSDKDSERPMLDPETIRQNMKTYVDQAGKILNIKKCEIRYNSEWLKKITFEEISRQADNFSLNEFISRENIHKRLHAGRRISLRELLYPLMQGYDSVMVKADVEIGGTDQKFNLLAGRELQRYYKQEPQDILMNPLIEGPDGRKMSSSWGNTINLLDSADDMFGKVMSMKDEFIMKYLMLTTRVPLSEIETIKAMRNPRDQKACLAREIVTMYHGENAAMDAARKFDTIFRQHEIPEDVAVFETSKKEYPVLELLCDSHLAESKSDAKRVIEGGGVQINKRKIADWRKVIEIQDEMVIQFGKRKFVKIKIT